MPKFSAPLSLVKYELGFSDMSKVYVFRGSKELSKDQVLEQLGLGAAGRRAGRGSQKGGDGLNHLGGAPSSGINLFLLPASECEYTLNSLLDELGTDQWPVAPGNRALRCTRVALSVAAGLLGASTVGTGARIIALLGGPCTEGPGSSLLIVSDPLIAKHILKDNSKACSKGILAEILDFVMGKGLIPAHREIWRVRRRAIVPTLHQKVILNDPFLEKRVEGSFTTVPLRDEFLENARLFMFETYCRIHQHIDMGKRTWFNSRVVGFDSSNGFEYLISAGILSK